MTVLDASKYHQLCFGKEWQFHVHAIEYCFAASVTDLRAYLDGFYLDA